MYFNGDLGTIISSENNINKNNTTEIKIFNSGNVSPKNYTGIVNIELPDISIKNDSTYKYDYISFDKDADNIKNIIANSKSNIYDSTEEVASSISLKNAFKLYDTDLDIVKAYNNTPINKIISKNYHWNIPVTDINHSISHVISIEKHSNKWEISKIAECPKNDNILLNYNYDKISKILNEQGFEDAQNIKLINTGKYHTMLLYFTHNGKEYGLPFNTRLDLINLQNDTVYEMSDIINVLDKAFN